MYFTYIDESGDTGTKSKYFILSGIIIHENNLEDILLKIIEFRQEIKKKYRLNIREEIHSTEFVNRKVNPRSRKSFEKISKNIRIKILKDTLLFVNSLNIKTFSVVLDKEKHFNKRKDIDILEFVWNVFLNRIDSSIKHKNIDGKADEKTIIISDMTTDKIIKISRKLKKINYVPSKFYNNSRQISISTILEDPFMKDSKESYFLQCVDVICYFVKQLYDPHFEIQKKGLNNYYKRISNIHLSVVSGKNNIGIVEL